MASSLFVKARVPARLEVEFTVDPGVTVLFGPSGAGKSTCLSVVAGLLAPEAGSHIRLGELEMVDWPVHRRRFGMVFQSMALFPHLNALGNAAYGAASKAAAMDWLTRFRAAHVAQKRPAQLSGGESQRVALARAFASQPRVLLLDEPFSALDFELRATLRDEVRQWVDSLEVPALWVTHDREEAAAFGSRVLFLSQGRIMSASNANAAPERHSIGPS
jgi:ABC-type sulfate/molybdate transport systems ATPase subunit